MSAPRAAPRGPGRDSSGESLRLLRLNFAHFLLVEPDEIDGIDHQRRVSAVAHRSRNDLACEGEQQSRAFDHYQGVHVFLRDILDAENAGIDQLESEQQLAV